MKYKDNLRKNISTSPSSNINGLQPTADTWSCGKVI